MSAQATPGPWAPLFGEHPNPAVLRADGKTIGLAIQRDDWRKGDGIPREVAEANARLFAAAPDLLAELQKAHALLQLALKHMGGERQALFAAESERVGLGTDGATRHHERAAVIAGATA